MSPTGLSLLSLWFSLYAGKHSLSWNKDVEMYLHHDGIKIESKYRHDHVYTMCVLCTTFKGSLHARVVASCHLIFIFKILTVSTFQTERVEHFILGDYHDNLPSIETILCAECWCCRSSLLGFLGTILDFLGTRHSNTGYLQAGTHFADLGRMTGRVNPTWY